MKKRNARTKKSASKQITKGLLDKLIMPGRRGALNALSDEEMKKEVVDALQNDNQLKGTKEKYNLTPKGILYALIQIFYSNSENISQFEKFQKDLVERLSMIASNNAKKDMFGKDFNEFFSIVVTTMNLLNKVINKLHENGIECDIRQMLEEDDDDGQY